MKTSTRSKIPKIPVTFNPRDLATLLPSRSSRSVQSALSSLARAIASASPGLGNDCSATIMVHSATHSGVWHGLTIQMQQTVESCWC
jgi:hypothetical protein